MGDDVLSAADESYMAQEQPVESLIIKGNKNSKPFH